MRFRSPVARVLWLFVLLIVAVLCTPTAALAQGAGEDGATAFLPLIHHEQGALVVVDAIAAGRDFTCAHTTQGRVHCWGDNEHGQLGNGTTTASVLPVRVAPLASQVTSLAAGDWGHVCALTVVGGVLCWGFNGHGQLGDNTRVDRWSPVAVVGLTSGVSALTAGHGHTCALTGQGTVFCWGHNDTHQLGNGSRQKRLFPGVVPGLSGGAHAIGAGFWHTCAATSTAVRCWGSNENGELGTTRSGRTPVEVRGLPDGLASLAGGIHFTCGLTHGARVYCWGANDHGQLGDGTATSRLRPAAVRTLTEPVQAIVAGDFHACALTASGEVRCWGRNDMGQLGDGSYTSRATPVTVNGLGGRVKALAAGRAHTCAVTDAGSMWCWGANDAGQLGDGTTTSSPSPVYVRSGE